MILLTETERVRRFVKSPIILIHMEISQVTVSGVPFQKVVDVAKELQMIRRKGYEQCDGKRTHHSCHFGTASPKC